MSDSTSYRGGAAVLSVGIGVTGFVTYAYFALASYALDDVAYGRVTLLWSAVFIVVSVLYRPVEQLLSRTIAERGARGHRGGAHLRVATQVQLALAAAFAVLALAFRERLEDALFDGSTALYWVFVVSVLAYAASYFARGFLAGHRRFGLYGGLVLMESLSRVLFALAVAIGLAGGETAVALGIVAAPIVSLAVVPWALGRRLGSPAAPRGAPADDAPAQAVALDDAAAGGSSAQAARGETEFTLGRGAGFAAAVLVIMLCEQAFLNAGPLVVNATAGAEGPALAGLVFNVLLIARAPLQLFQSVQTAILPHLTRLSISGESDPFRRSVNLTLVAVAAFAALVALALLAVGPALMDLVFDDDFTYGRGGLALVGIAMGLYLAAATLNQAALARGQARRAAACWAASATAFLALVLAPCFDDRVLQVEIAFTAGAALLCALLYALYRWPSTGNGQSHASGA